MKKIICFLVILFPVFLASQPPTDYHLIDLHASRAPSYLRSDIGDLTDFLSAPASNEFEIVRSFFVWIGKNVEYDKKAVKNGDISYNYEVEQILERGKAICTGFSNLFRKMCRLKNIPCEVISGYSKGTLTSQNDPKEPDHAWNAVLLDGKWYLLDVTWGAGLSNFTTGRPGLIHEDYFLPQPDQFILDHMPSMPFWQLLDCPLSIAQFGFNPEVRLSGDSSKTNCISFQDSIEYFIQLNTVDKRLKEAIDTYQFHPTSENHDQLAHGYLDHAASLVDSSEQYVSTQNLERLLDLQKQVLSDCRKAEAITNFHTWQKEMYAHTLINHTAALFNDSDSGVSRDASFYNGLLENLYKAREILRDTEATYFTNAAKKQCDEFVALISRYLE